MKWETKGKEDMKETVILEQLHGHFVLHNECLQKFSCVSFSLSLWLPPVLGLKISPD